MHVEKNVFDTLMGTILDIEGKTRDRIKARLHLERMGIRRGLWMNRVSDKTRRDPAFFSIKPNDKKDFLKFVSSVKFSDGYSSNIARCVNVDRGKFTRLKSHDYHVFVQRLLPIGIRHLLPEDVAKLIMLLSRFFSQLTAKTLQKTDINHLRHDIVQVLGKFEKIFPPAFFTSIIHVMVHLPKEALLAGSVNYRWMYSIERLLGELLKAVHNRVNLEGSIIEAWVQYESLTFCGMVGSLAINLDNFVAIVMALDTHALPVRVSGHEMSNLIRSHKAVSTAHSSRPPVQPSSAATTLAQMNHLPVGPGLSHAPASSASSVAQPVSAKHLQHPASTTDTTSTDATIVSGSQPAKKYAGGPCQQLKTARVTRVTNSRINIGYDEWHRVAPTAELHSSLPHDIGHVVQTHCPMQWKSWKVMSDEIKTEVVPVAGIGRDEKRRMARFFWDRCHPKWWPDAAAAAQKQPL
ncbi:hypothetical protein L3X38_026737 [Prunus dulcis]|uniref:DUF4218 domain-containing protein n=1 Tax=Prunus dulcis TaxID=3755 RepID=A0AAD4VMI7_PRUDU|nr:hypothetical protein L3X38_026737 [Prunus dulcis]